MRIYRGPGIQHLKQRPSRQCPHGWRHILQHGRGHVGKGRWIRARKFSDVVTGVERDGWGEALWIAGCRCRGQAGEGGGRQVGGGGGGKGVREMAGEEGGVEEVGARECEGRVAGAGANTGVEGGEGGGKVVGIGEGAGAVLSIAAESDTDRGERGGGSRGFGRGLGRREKIRRCDALYGLIVLVGGRCGVCHVTEETGEGGEGEEVGAAECEHCVARGGAAAGRDGSECGGLVVGEGDRGGQGEAVGEEGEAGGAGIGGGGGGTGESGGGEGVSSGACVGGKEVAAECGWRVSGGGEDDCEGGVAGDGTVEGRESRNVGGVEVSVGEGGEEGEILLQTCGCDGEAGGTGRVRWRVAKHLGLRGDTRGQMEGIQRVCT